MALLTLRSLHCLICGISSRNSIEGTVAGADQIQEALSHVDYKNVQLDSTTVTLLDPQASIDLGGIAKGYIADRLRDYLVSKAAAAP